MSEELSVRFDGHVGVLQIRRPPNNHFDLDLLRELAEEAEKAAASPGCRALVLTSEGKNFCAGVDFSGTGIGATPDRTLRALYTEGRRLFDLPVPVVAAVQGAAVGGGLGLACAADFRVAAPSSRFHANFGRLGLHQGFGITLTLPRLAGEQKAADMLYTARRVTGTEAHAIGLADHLTDEDTADAVREAALVHAHRITTSAPLAVRSMKATLRAGLRAALPAAMEHEAAEQVALMDTDDHRVGVAASLDRTDTAFTGF
ncbi:enoyl-CoA hydratase/isomerase family protein [Nocardiopsis xinjiangensis]|uniref:enoyl-CoA hydratase/isomerase family protein n=1 Tax=Nocardiopsis xinjiangensis TaxID=124285 RepID=UPI0003483F82|nr:enoyl-CoA hydratase/isomerase family protein [Nocardiopsis xinjiangensis]